MRSHTFRARNKTLRLRERTAVMGIVNITPDSFYPGSRYPVPEDAVAVSLELVEHGADILDLGAESTRPGGRAVPEDEELDRLLPVLRALRPRTDALISIDTRKASVAEAVLDAGADLINDVTALGDERMGEVVARYGAGVALMHMQGTPETMQREPYYEDVVSDVKTFLQRAVSRAEAAGIGSDRILVDPGIGFGKTLAHNLSLLRELASFTELGKPILIGTSRKSFIGRLLQNKEEDRLLGTAASVAAAVLHGASVVRVHDVRAMRDVTRVADAIRVTPKKPTARLRGIPVAEEVSP